MEKPGCSRRSVGGKDLVEALQLYHSRKFRQALRLLKTLPMKRQQDLSIGRLMEICQEYAQDPPPDDWDRIRESEKKIHESGEPG